MNQTLVKVVERATCPVQGNSDLYGLGIRIGLYIQLLTVQISGLTSQLMGVNDLLSQGVVIFILSAGTVLLKLILRREIEPVEVFPILSLLIVQLAVCRVPFWRAQTTIFIYVGELTGLTALTTWFWWHGMDTLPRSCVDDYAFFFVKVSIWHWFRKFNKVLSIMVVIGAAIGIISYIECKSLLESAPEE